MPRHCWCGYAPLEPFDEHYLRCPSCDTLIRTEFPADLGLVEDDAAAFYGHDYWFAHQATMGLPDILSRARSDFGDRLLSWLDTLLTYRVPPLRSLELGCSHGGFVALLRQAGYDATGLELSPRIAALARQLFDVPVLVGPIESQALPDGSFDVIIAMDVLEHLTDPVATVRTIVQALAPGGVVMFQTPSYPSGAHLDVLQEAAHPFLSMLLPDEHTYLFSRRSLSLLLQRAGLPHVSVQPAAVFSQYDMCVVASREPLAIVPPEERERALLATPRGRLVQALLDRASETRELQASLAQRAADVGSLADSLTAAESDRAARLQVIEQQGAALGVAEARVLELAAESASLRAHFAASEADRQARLELIERQGAELAAVAAAAEQAAAFEQRLADCESDRRPRLAVIEEQGRELGSLRAAVADLERRLVASEDDRDARLRVIEAQGATIGELTTARDASARKYEEQDRRLAEIERHLADAGTTIAALNAYVARLETTTGVRVLRRLGQLPPPPETP